MDCTKDLILKINEKAKSLLLGHNCSNCFWAKNTWKVSTTPCVKIIKTFNNYPGDIVEYMTNNNICRHYVDYNIMLDNGL